MRRFDLPSMILLTETSVAICLAILTPAWSQGTAPRTILPNGREIRPVGTWVSVAPYPFAIALRPDGEEAVVPSIGFPFALNVISHPTAPEPSVRRLPEGKEKVPAIATHAGLTYSPDGKVLYAATGDSGQIAVYDTTDWKQIGRIELDGIVGGKTFKGSFAATVIVSSSGRWLYALDQGNWRVVVIDAVSRERIASVETGAYPFALALSPDENRLYVTNSGLFEYKPLKNSASKEKATEGLPFPPFGYPSKTAREGTNVDGVRVAGLGDENSSRGSSLWTYTVSDPHAPVIAAKLRLGNRILATTIGGAAPTGVAADSDAAYVALAHQDSVVKISADGTHLLGEATLTPFRGLQFVDARGNALRGVMPSGLAVRDGKLYVAESGINAVAIVSTQSMQVVAHLPVGWNPSAVAISRDGEMLYVVNTKGKGTGANAGKDHDPLKPSYIGSLEYGSVSAISLKTVGSPADMTAAVVAANTASIVNKPALPRLKHCFLIIRENRTFDEVLGDVAGANGDPSLARYGMDGWAEESKVATHLKVTPNLHGLLRQFASSDNFYVDSDVSADGHRWMLGINPTPFFNTAWTSNYGGRRKATVDAEGPGRRAMFGGADAPMPEDEPQFGSLWEHIANAGKGVLNYGEGLEVEGSDEIEGLLPEGQRMRLNSPIPRPIFESTDRHFPTFNLGIPDQLRADEFERDFTRRLAENKVPGLIVIRLPNDHTAGIRPDDGYPYRASYVADNDLALGRIIQFLSHSSVWKDSAVFMTEDDAQGGVDHVDAHRSLLLVASPWVRAGSMSHVHTDMGSIIRTIDELLGLGSMNLEDALASEMTDVFDDHPNMVPYQVEPADPRVFVPARARVAHPKTKAEAAALRNMDDADEIRPAVEATARAASARKVAK